MQLAEETWRKLCWPWWFGWFISLLVAVSCLLSHATNHHAIFSHFTSTCVVTTPCLLLNFFIGAKIRVLQKGEKNNERWPSYRL
jgi:hypothetical protein